MKPALPVPWLCPSCGWGRATRRPRGKNHRVYIAGTGALMRGQRFSEAPRPIRVYWPLVGVARRGPYNGGRLARACPDPWHKRFRRPMQRPGYGKPAEKMTLINLHDPDVTTRRKTKAQRHKSHQAKEKR